MKNLGDAERQTCFALAAVGGKWKPGDRPLWEGNGYWTQKILESLLKKNVVSITSDGTFVLIRSRPKANQ